MSEGATGRFRAESAMEENPAELLNGSGATAQGKAERVACVECGEKYHPVNESNRFYRNTEGVHCAKRSACRARQLGTEFDRRGLKQWGRRTQQQLLIIMDCPPKDWDKTKKWESVTDNMERVAAAIEYSSLCYPVCLFEAVQTGPDGEPIWDQYTGQWKYHTHRTLGEFLGLHQSTVSRAILGLKLRHRVDYDDGRTWIDLDPKPLSISERDACTRHADDASGSEDGQGDANDPSVARYKAILPSARKVLAHHLTTLPVDACTRLHEVAVHACRHQNGLFSDARAWTTKTIVDACREERTRAENGVPDACNGGISLLSRVREGAVDPPSTLSSSSAVEPMRAQSPLEDRGFDDDDTTKTPVDELQAAGLGRGALAKLPSPRPVLPEPEPPRMVAEEFHRTLAGLFRKAGKPVPNRNQTAPHFSALGIRASAFITWFEDEKKAQKLNHPGGLPSVVKEFFDTPEKEATVTFPGMRPMLRSEAIALLEKNEKSEDPEVQKWAQEQLAMLTG